MLVAVAKIYLAGKSAMAGYPFTTVDREDEMIWPKPLATGAIDDFVLFQLPGWLASPVQQHERRH